MIFTNEGMVQFPADPLETAFDLAMVIRGLNDRYQTLGADSEYINTVLLVAKKLAVLSDEEITDFFNRLPKGIPFSLDDVVTYLEQYNHHKNKLNPKYS